ncbi:phage regulatory CII family protein [Vibrio crassostreae]|uniref:phage regulatory CII family protein n=1 Tax=Vibrio crassostreae TaxID=246167 RepID=UPI001B3025E7|nr:phage regulatory CII family protein [Vibrio crassostreae]
MNGIDSIGEFSRTKQGAFNEACCVFARSENMARLAEVIGMSPTMLRNKLNPYQPHVLSCVEAITLAKVSGNHIIVNSLLLGLGVVTAYIPPNTTDDAFVLCALESSTHSGELSRMALEYAGKPRLTRAQKYEIVQTVHANISGQVLLLNSLEKLNQSVGLLKAIGRKGGR